jgi:hypothetical protein
MSGALDALRGIPNPLVLAARIMVVARRNGAIFGMAYTLRLLSV